MASALAFFLPWQLSPTVMITGGVALALYSRGSSRMRPPVPAGRRLAFYLGAGVIYCALQTRWEYYAGHMLFVLQLQHFALHDLGPVLLAWAAPRAALTLGLPRCARARAAGAQRVTHACARLLLNPVIAAATYVAALLVWTWPPLTFDVMLSNGLYRLMSWSVLAGALPFWALVLEPRPYPRARLKPGQRIVMLHLAMLPIVLTGAGLTLTERNLYPVYAVCGRFLPLPPVADQQIAGAVMWVLGAAVFAVAFFVVLGRNLRQEEAALSVRPLTGQS